MHSLKQKTQNGFTLIELMIVIAIIGILASLAVPAYQTYTKKAKFSEVVSAVSPYKTALEVCFQEQASLLNCTNGNNGVPAITPATAGYVLAGSGAVTNNDALTADITMTDSGINGLSGDTYILRGVAANASSPIIWSKTANPGTCVAAAIC